MDETDRLSERFDAERGRLVALAYRMLGSRDDAEDAVQESWMRLNRADHSADKITGINVVADPERLSQIELVVLEQPVSVRTRQR